MKKKPQRVKFRYSRVTIDRIGKKATPIAWLHENGDPQFGCDSPGLQIRDLERLLKILKRLEAVGC